jgi:TatD DNase family protein
MLTDTHAHLSDPKFDPDREATLRRAGDAGVRTIVEIADAPSGWKAARELAESSFRPDAPVEVHWTCGFHPHYAEESRNFDFGIMVQAAMSPGCVAVGEIGLDYAKSESSKETQAFLFTRTLEVAAECRKPVVVHCRDAQADTLRILRSFFGGLSGEHLCPGVIHCFQGDIHFAEGCLDLGFLLGVDGPITYPGAGSLREVIAQVPLEKLVLETDSPYLPPQDFRGKRNESAYLPKIAEKLAQVKGADLETVSRVTTENAARLFRLRKTL